MIFLKNVCPARDVGLGHDGHELTFNIPGLSEILVTLQDPFDGSSEKVKPYVCEYCSCVFFEKEEG